MATNTVAIPPLPASVFAAFPPLMEIEDAALAKQVVTHSSYHQTPKNSAMMEVLCSGMTYFLWTAARADGRRRL